MKPYNYIKNNEQLNNFEINKDVNNEIKDIRTIAKIKGFGLNEPRFKVIRKKNVLLIQFYSTYYETDIIKKLTNYCLDEQIVFATSYDRVEPIFKIDLDEIEINQMYDIKQIFFKGYFE